MICECKSEPICELCYKDHAGMDHKKVFIKDVCKTFPKILQQKIQDTDNFFKTYRSSTAGKFFEAYLDFFDKCIEAIN